MWGRSCWIFFCIIKKWNKKKRNLNMSIYMSRLFPKANSSFLLSNGNALQASVVRLRDDMYLVDAGIGSPRTCMKDELTKVPIKRATRFENKVGFTEEIAGTTPVKERMRILERMFIDLVAGDSVMKERAIARFNDKVGSSDAVAGEPLLVLPRKFRQNQAWLELNKIWRTNKKVRGFIIDKVKGGYSVAIGGYITFLPYRPLNTQRFGSDRFTVESINAKKNNIVVF